MTLRLISILFMALMSTNLSAHQFEGDWQFIKGEYKTASGEVLYADNSTLVAIKTIKGSKFAFNNMQQGEFLGYLSGTFTVEGGSYKEHIKKHVKQSGPGEHAGKVFTFQGWLEEKQEHGQKVIYWHHKGMVAGTEETEVWRKLNK